jgi:CRP-like cAMP-binding protein
VALNSQTILLRNRLFRGLPAATIERIASLGRRRNYPRGAIIFSQADPGDALYGVVSGKVLISASAPDGREMFLNIMEPGDTFGEIAMLDGHRRTATANATAACDLVIITRNDFMDFLPREPKLVEHLLELLCQRIRWTSGLAEESALLSVPARLARRLLSLGTLHGRQTAEGIQLSVSQEEVARFMGISRQVVNQYLQKWKARNWVTLGRGRMVIIDSQALRDLIAGNLSLDEDAADA